MSQDTLSVELEIREGNAAVVIGKNKQLLEDFVKSAEKAQPNIKFAVPNQNYIDLDKLEKRAALTRKSFEDIGKTRIDSGQLGNLTGEILNAQTRARILAGDIINIRRELANPARKSSIADLALEAKGAETELDKVVRKLNQLPSLQSSLGAPSGAGGKSSGGRKGITETQRALLEVADDFVPAGFNRPFNAVAREVLAATNAKIALTAATTASTAATVAEGAATTATTTAVQAETAAFAGLSLASLGIFAGVAAAGFAAVKISENIRAEAENYLKVQTSITAAINNQILSQQEGIKNFDKSLELAKQNRDFARQADTDSLQDLQRKKDYYVQLSRIISPTLPVIENGKAVQKSNPDFEKNQQQALDIDARLAAKSFQIGQPGDSFNQRNEDFKKSQQQAIEFERKRSEDAVKAERKRSEDVEKAKTKLKELEKQYTSTFDALNSRVGADNPIYQVFNQGDVALRDLRKNLAGLPVQLQAVAAAAQEKLNLKARLSVEVDNKLASFDLRSQADNFRNPFDGAKQKKDQEDFVQNFLRNNPNYLFLQGKNSLDDSTRSQIFKQFAPSSLNETAADRFNKTLDEKFSLIYKPRQSVEEQAIADKKFIALTQGANPLDLSRNLREGAASAREREAARLENYQQESNRLLRENLEVNKLLLADAKNKTAIAEKGGANALKVLIRDETKDGVDYEFLSARPQAGAEIEKPYQFGGFGLGGGTNR